MEMKKINSGKVVIAGDSHQGLSWLNAIISKEEPFDKFIHLGDHLDTFNQIDAIRYFSVKAVCEWINEKRKDDRFIWLLANHDLAYLASYTPRQVPPKASFYSCSGWTRNKAKQFNKHIDPEWFKQVELCCKVGDFYCVHAGFSYQQFKPFMSESENIEKLYHEWEADKMIFHHKPWHWINYIGPARYGLEEYSSPIWLDFGSEFVPLDETQIICGHTHDYGNPRCKKNSIGLENYCIDGGQTCYAVWEDGRLDIRFVQEKDYDEFLDISDHQTYRVD
jgi:hypothetical protein